MLYKDFKQLAPYFHTITYSDYEDDFYHETTERITKGFGCSILRKGDLFGRNYDYYYTDMPSFLVKMKRNRWHFKSIGIANHVGLTEEETLKYEADTSAIDIHSIAIIPNFTRDGINEKGVACAINIVSLEDIGGLPTSTNPGKPRLNMMFVVRFVLDNAESADHAVSLLNELDLYLVGNRKYNVHYMISDPNKTYIVEVLNEHGRFVLRSREKKLDDQIMTNFYLNMTPEEVKATGSPTNYNNNAIGVERYRYLKERYFTCTDLESLASLLHNVRYSIAYNNPYQPAWPSEDFTQVDIQAENFGRYYTIYRQTRDVLDHHKRRLGTDFDVWITVHSAIYDIRHKKVYVAVQENFNQPFSFSLNDF
ncbi:MAG: carcinine hydrolase/isopenicillin-N N-acyltransferase family protein [Bacilli bacterium]|nr:carcinine hydrolase/isopenicillin-N N-acyltransferase family protein [Bacilli bacterium]